MHGLVMALMRGMNHDAPFLKGKNVLRNPRLPSPDRVKNQLQALVGMGAVVGADVDRMMPSSHEAQRASLRLSVEELGPSGDVGHKARTYDVQPFFKSNSPLNAGICSISAENHKH